MNDVARVDYPRPYAPDLAEKEAARVALFAADGACTALLTKIEVGRCCLTLPNSS